MKKIVLFAAFCLCGSASFGFHLAGHNWAPRQATVNVDIKGLSASGISWDNAFQVAMAQWTIASPFDFEFEDSFTDPCMMRGPGQFGDGIPSVGFRTDICGNDFGEGIIAINLAAGLCIVNDCSTGFNANDTDTLFNDNISWDIYSGDINPDVPDFYRVALHELGHALGLAHEDDIPSIMNTNVSNIETLQPDDIQGVAAIYSGGDSLATIYGPTVELPPGSEMQGSFNIIELSGSLDSSDDSFDGQPVDVYQFTLKNDSRVNVVLNRGDPEVSLRLARVTSTQDIMAGYDFTARRFGIWNTTGIYKNLQAGTYWIATTPVSAATTGKLDYEIEITAATTSQQHSFAYVSEPLGAQAQVNPNPVIKGYLETSDYLNNDRFIDYYQFEVTRPTQLKIDLTSSQFDPMLTLVKMRKNRTFDRRLFFQDSNSGESVNASLSQTLQPGTYWIGASSDDFQETGFYRIDISLINH